MSSIFLSLAPARFFGALGKDVFDFSIAFENKLYNLGLIKTLGIDYNNF